MSGDIVYKAMLHQKIQQKKNEFLGDLNK